MASRRHTVALTVTPTGYQPADDAGREQHAKFEVGSVVGAEIARNRSVVQNSLYWSVLSKVVQVAGDYPTPEKLHLALKVHLGFVEKVRLINGKMVLLDSSTAFDAMNQTEFQSYVDAAFRTIETDIMGGMSIDEILAHADGKTPRPSQPGDAPMTAPRRDLDKQAKFFRERIELLPTVGRLDEFSKNPRFVTWMEEAAASDPKLHAEILDALAERRGILHDK